VAEDEKEPSDLIDALKSDVNLIVVGTAIGFAILSGSFLPLILAAGLEMAGLPLLERYQRYQRARQREKERTEKEQNELVHMLDAMPELERQHYRALQSLAGEIRNNYKQMTSTSQALLQQLSDKLDVLLSFYLRMRYSLSRLASYFRTTQPDRIHERIAMLEHEMAASGAERVQQVKARTRAVLLKRLERYAKAQENRELINAQTETIQEVLHLLRDQSYSMRDPRSIAEQVDGLISSAEETERGVKDLEEILGEDKEMALLGGLGMDDVGTDIEAELEKGRVAAPPPLPASPSPRVREAMRDPSAIPPTHPPPPRKKTRN